MVSQLVPHLKMIQFSYRCSLRHINFSDTSTRVEELNIPTDSLYLMVWTYRALIELCFVEFKLYVSY